MRTSDNPSSTVKNPQVNPQKSYTRESWQGGYKSLTQEYDYWIEDIEGEIPADLNGTFLKNGPALFEINGEKIHHPFDGDGMISKITFTKGRAHFQNRFVQTEGYLAEQKAGKILYRGVFGTQKAGGWLNNFGDFKLKNIANTNVIYWGGKLLALWEAAEPHRLDPHTLETLGKEYFRGVLGEGDAFSAHPRFDPASKFHGGQPCMVNFSLKTGLATTINIFELDTSGEIIRKYAHSVPGFCFIHDFAITENYCIFFQNPVQFNPIPFALGMRGAGECIKFQPNQPTRVIIISRDPAKPEIKTLEIQSGFVFHHANAFEQDGEIIVDSICYANLPEVEPESDFREVNFEALSPGQLWRFRLNLANQTVKRELLESRCCEFPDLHPDRVGQTYRYVYMGVAHEEKGNSPLQGFVKLDLQTGKKLLWSAAPHGFAGEPIFVPRSPSSDQASSAEDHGWLLGLIYNSQNHRSEVVILNAKDFSVVCKLRLRHHIPYGLHGNFTQEVLLSALN